MITDERIASFINSFNSDYDDVITAIRKEAEEQEVPIIRREAGEFIKLLMMIKKPVNILEIGTAVGFSAIFMSRFLREEGHITTIENYRPRIEKAKANIRLAQAEDRITLLAGDANEILPTWHQSCCPTSYLLPFLPFCFRLFSPSRPACHPLSRL